MLNDALTAQLDRLMNADDDTVDMEIKRSNAVSQLAANINQNMSNAVKVSRLLAEEGMDVTGLRKAMPAMLQKPVEDKDFDAIGWVAENGGGHTVSWIRDRLNTASGCDYSFDEVRGICDEAGVEPVNMNVRSWNEASRAKFEKATA